VADKDIEINTSILDGVHNSFLELAEHCLKLGVRVDNITFNYYNPMSFVTTQKEILISVNINSSKVKDR
jgi:hypothetical protein